MRRTLSIPALFALLPLVTALPSCREPSQFGTDGDHFEGTIVAGDFVRTGFDSTTKVCLTLDTRTMQTAPGAISSSDGRFKATPMRPMPQLFNDPLSWVQFGEGRERNFIYAATPMVAGTQDYEPDVTLFVSLMQSGDVEVRMLRGAPGAPASASSPTVPAPAPLFGVFPLSRKPGACSF